MTASDAYLREPGRPMKMGRRSGFSLIELLVVIAIIGILLAVSVSLFKRTGSESLRTSADRFMSMVEQGRTAAITRRKPVALALFNPVAGSENPARLGLFELTEWEAGKPAVGTLIQRFEAISPGMVFLPGGDETLLNVVESPAISLTWKNGQERAEVPLLVFSPRGGLLAPAGSGPVRVSVGGAVLRNGTFVENKTGRREIRVGRVVARPWLLDE